MAVVLADELNGILVDLGEAQDRMHAAYHRASALSRGPNPLPAPLTEDAIVAALKADPGMAGRVMPQLAVAFTFSELGRFAEASRLEINGYSRSGRDALQSLAVALSAASYRGVM